MSIPTEIMSLPKEIILHVFEQMADTLSLKEVFSLRYVNRLFADGLFKAIHRNGRLEKDGFHIHHGPCNEWELHAWNRSPTSLKIKYLKTKLGQHSTKPTEFSRLITRMLALDEVKDAPPEERDIILNKLLYGLSALYILDCGKFIHGHGPPLVMDLVDDQPLQILRCVNVTITCRRFHLTPVFIAATNGTADMTAILTKCPAVFEGDGSILKTVFECAIHRHNKATIEIWLPIVRALRKFQVGEILEAGVKSHAGNGSVDMVKFLLDRCTGDENYIRYRALIPAIKARREEVLKLLVNYPGFDAEFVSIYCEQSVLRVAIRCRNRQKRKAIIKILQSAGVDEYVTVRLLEGDGDTKDGKRAELVLSDDGYEDEDEEEDYYDEDDLEDEDTYVTMKMSDLRF
ncbi:hypothetical protein BDW62DRAFT_215895 [Aspergillus aurantiobrunneus]